MKGNLNLFCRYLYFTWFQVEEEALISSGSSEKEDDNLANTSDSNSTGSGGTGGNSNAGSKKAVCSKVNTSEPIQDVEVIFFFLLVNIINQINIFFNYEEKKKKEISFNQKWIGLAYL